MLRKAKMFSYKPLLYIQTNIPLQVEIRKHSFLFFCPNDSGHSHVLPCKHRRGYRIKPRRTMVEILAEAGQSSVRNIILSV